jgi:hypothetical protein
MHLSNIGLVRTGVTVINTSRGLRSLTNTNNNINNNNNNNNNSSSSTLIQNIERRDISREKRSIKREEIYQERRDNDRNGVDRSSRLYGRSSSEYFEFF